MILGVVEAVEAKMRYFAYDELDQEEPVIYSEEYILEYYYPYWKSEMIKKLGDVVLTKEECINDWIVVNWAWEVKQ